MCAAPDRGPPRHRAGTRVRVAVRRGGRNLCLRAGVRARRGRLRGVSLRPSAPLQLPGAIPAGGTACAWGFGPGCDSINWSHIPENTGCKRLRISPRSVPCRHAVRRRPGHCKIPGKGGSGPRADIGAVRPRGEAAADAGRVGEDGPVNGHDAPKHEGAAPRGPHSPRHAAILRLGAGVDPYTGSPPPTPPATP